MSLSAALKKAKKLVRQREIIASEVSNKCIVTTEYNSSPQGALVVILYTDNTDSESTEPLIESQIEE